MKIHSTTPTGKLDKGKEYDLAEARVSHWTTDLKTGYGRVYAGQNQAMLTGRVAFSLSSGHTVVLSREDIQTLSRALARADNSNAAIPDWAVRMTKD